MSVSGSVSRNSEPMWIPDSQGTRTHFKIHFYPFSNRRKCTRTLLLSFHRKLSVSSGFPGTGTLAPMISATGYLLNRMKAFFFCIDYSQATKLRFSSDILPKISENFIFIPHLWNALRLWEMKIIFLYRT